MTTAILPGMAERLHISEREWVILQSIFREHLRAVPVYAFGSRATGGARLRRFSDLDLAVPARLTSTQRAAVTEAFDQSLLDFKVDLIELDRADPDFGSRISRDFLLVHAG